MLSLTAVSTLASLLGTSLSKVANLPIGACRTDANNVNASSLDGSLARTSIWLPSKSWPSTTKALISNASKFFAYDFKSLAAAPGSSKEKANKDGPTKTSSEHPKSVPSKASFANEFLIT